ncbi:MAG TPA: flagellar biosynthesis anti-sigma factor FlgM [Phycisphaerae bacterium]|nr:flagellar biosynthesis anti-sigma factor FlgM [Phycisphaerae bacterium]HRW54143.1 flagellar biosynthesis anti-sigma factor FlgM [Phycisphaerae bacterium]
MADIGIIDGLASSATLREFAQQSTRRVAPKLATEQSDRVEISELARFLNQLAELPDERARRIVDIRSQIDKGTFVTSERLNIASERLFEDIGRSGSVAF